MSGLSVCSCVTFHFRFLYLKHSLHRETAFKGLFTFEVYKNCPEMPALHGRVLLYYSFALSSFYCCWALYCCYIVVNCLKSTRGVRIMKIKTFFYLFFERNSFSLFFSLIIFYYIQHVRKCFDFLQLTKTFKNNSENWKLMIDFHVFMNENLKENAMLLLAFFKNFFLILEFHSGFHKPF